MKIKIMLKNIYNYSIKFLKNNKIKIIAILISEFLNEVIPGERVDTSSIPYDCYFTDSTNIKHESNKNVANATVKLFAKSIKEEGNIYRKYSLCKKLIDFASSEDEDTRLYTINVISECLNDISNPIYKSEIISLIENLT